MKILAAAVTAILFVWVVFMAVNFVVSYLFTKAAGEEYGENEWLDPEEF